MGKTKQNKKLYHSEGRDSSSIATVWYLFYHLRGLERMREAESSLAAGPWWFCQQRTWSELVIS